MFTETIEDALKELDDYLRNSVGSCGDGGCIILKPEGMHTNGGCRCAENRQRMQRFAYAHNRFAKAIRKLND